MVHHLLRISPYKMFISERSVTCSFFQELCSNIDKNSGKKFEDMFPVKIANEGTSLNYVFFSWSFLELLDEALFCHFLCYTYASGPHLVTNRKALILHEHKTDCGKIFKR